MHLLVQVRRIRYPVVEDEEPEMRKMDPTSSYAEGWDPERWEDLGWDIVQPSGRVVRTGRSITESPPTPAPTASDQKARLFCC
jgi:hypothetical protein